MTRSAKPAKCATCGDTNADNFYGDRKTKCKLHHNLECVANKPRKGKKKNAFEKLSLALQTEFMSELSHKNNILVAKYNLPLTLISAMRTAQRNAA